MYGFHWSEDSGVIALLVVVVKRDDNLSSNKIKIIFFPISKTKLFFNYRYVPLVCFYIYVELQQVCIKRVFVIGEIRSRARPLLVIQQ